MRLIQNLKLSLVAATALGFALTSCQSEELPISQTETYTREFIKKFGRIDPRHDWNTAEQAIVTVTTGAPTTVKVLADVDGKRYLFATYVGIDGTRDITADLPKGTTRFLLQANGRTYAATPGAKLDLRGGRTISEYNEDLATDEDPNGKISITTTAGKQVIPVVALVDYLTQGVPEGGSNLDAEVNGKPLTKDFYFVGTGEPVTFYPLYWCSSSYHTLGVYWAKPDGTVDETTMRDIYYTKSGELEYNLKSEAIGTFYYQGCDKSGSLSEGEMCEEHNNTVYVADGTESFQLDWGGSKGNTYNGAHYHKIEWTEDNAWRKANAGANYGLSDSNQAYDFNKDNGDTKVLNVRSRGITLNMPKGLLYGFYLKTSEFDSMDPDRLKSTDPSLEGKTTSSTKDYGGQKWSTFSYTNENQDRINASDEDFVYHMTFSQRARNKKLAENDNRMFDGTSPKCLLQSQISNNDKSPDGYFAVYYENEVNGKKYSYFSFEDWGSSDCDLNDVVFIFDEQTSTKIVDEDDPDRYPDPEPEPEVWQWIIAAEDLGATDDFDFNDVVFGVSATTVVASATTGSEEASDKVETQEIEKTTVKITALAAGGTLPVYLYYQMNDKRNPDTDLIKPDGSANGEWHSWFGTGYGSNVMINTGAGPTAAGKTVEITVKDDFTLECCKTVKDQNMGGFYLQVVRNDGQHNNYIIEAPNLTETIAPQMLCLPGTWLWPIERTAIHAAYPEFNTWVASQTACTNWHQNPAGNVWKR